MRTSTLEGVSLGMVLGVVAKVTETSASTRTPIIEEGVPPIGLDQTAVEELKLGTPLVLLA
jgi:hypothetical protein